MSFILFLVIGSVIFSHFSNNSPTVSSAGQAQAKVIPTVETPPTIFPGVSTTESQNPEPTNGIGILEIITRLLVSVLLATVLAFRPRKNVHLFERNLYVAQTQILLAAVAGALMMIVGDNAARAFAIFAAVSLVRFRTNIRDPKEVTVLLICLALGLSAGVGRWDLGLTLCIFVLCLLWVLEYKEPEQAVRPMELTIKTRNVDSTNNALQKIFNKFRLETEVRKINAPDEGNPVGSIVHYLNLRLSLSTDFLSSQIITLDRENIEGIQWEQKKSATDIYQ
ncbi:MAG TPA: DUF4956 domain-containing protein [Pyrinomonadaceae bacterium]|nr:DUF4956 domain-containing protein [Pyrinomonadaceae bacterium]